MGEWKEVHRVSHEYLIGRGSYTICVTSVTSRESKEFKKMFEWCDKNLQDCWSMAQLEKNDHYISWRFYNEDEANQFTKKFKKYITS